MSSDDLKIGFLHLTAGEATQKNVMIQTNNIAFITETSLGQPGRSLIQLKQPPVLLPIAQAYDVLSKMYAVAVEQGGTHHYADYQNNVALCR